MYCMLLCSRLLNSMWIFLHFILGCFNTQNIPLVMALASSLQQNHYCQIDGFCSVLWWTTSCKTTHLRDFFPARLSPTYIPSLSLLLYPSSPRAHRLSRQVVGSQLWTAVFRLNVSVPTPQPRHVILSPLMIARSPVHLSSPSVPTKHTTHISE